MNHDGIGLRVSSGLLAVLGCLLVASPAFAAGGGLPTIVQDLSVSLLFAGAIAVVFARLRIPSIAAFILAGVLIGPNGVMLVTDPGNVEAIAQIGFVLLLFVIGLEIDVRAIMASGRSLIIAGVVQYPLTLLFGFLVTKLVIILGLGGILESSPFAPFYMGVAIAASSSLLVVKLFQEHFQLDTQPGRISLVILIFQDIWAIVVMLVLPSLANPDFMAILMSFVGIGLLLLIANFLARTVIRVAFTWIAKTPELILLGAVAWCFLLIAIGTNIDNATKLVGFNLHMAVGSGMAALIAGATVASLPFSHEIVAKVGLVRDFFVTLFFVALGIAMPKITGLEIPMLALFLGVLAILARQVVFFPLFYFLGIDQRAAQVSSVRLAQLSEFGLVIAYLALELGHINHEISSVIILAFVFTAILTTPLFKKAYDIYDWLAPTLTRLGFKEPEVSDETKEEVVLALLGIHRDASSFLYELRNKHPEVIAKTVVVDYNVALHDKVRSFGAHAEYGDVSNEETLIHAGIDRAKIILCTISDDLLRGITNRDLVRTLRRLNPGATIIANAIEIDAVDKIKEAGADVVYMTRIEVAHSLVNVIEHVLEENVDALNQAHQARSGPMDTREEIMR
jgi:Kef-type K+ transport system membrane component KefB